MANFYPLPPSFVGGAQPWAPHVGPAWLEQAQSAPPLQNPALSRGNMAVMAMLWAPAPTPPQTIPARLLFQISGDNPPLGGADAATRQRQFTTIQALQPSDPLPVQRRPTQIISGITPPPSPPIPPIPPVVQTIFPHDDYDTGWSFWKNTKRQDEAERLRQARIEIGLLPPDEEEPTEVEQIEEALDARVSVDEIAQRLSAHFYAKYQTALRQAQAKTDLTRETQRRRQDYLLSSAERAQRIETGKRLALRKAIEEDDAKVMALLNDLL